MNYAYDEEESYMGENELSKEKQAPIIYTLEAGHYLRILPRKMLNHCTFLASLSSLAKDCIVSEGGLKRDHYDTREKI